MQDVFELLKHEMAVRGWNVSRLAEACGTDVALTSRWVAENPERRVIPGPKSCAKISAALGLDPDYVLELAGHREPQTDREPVDAKAAALLAVWPNLEDWKQRAIQALAGLHPDARDSNAVGDGHSRRADATRAKLERARRAAATSTAKGTVRHQLQRTGRGAGRAFDALAFSETPASVAAA